MRTAVTTLGPLLAAVALSTYLVWERDLDSGWAAQVSIPSTAVAFVAAAWGILVAPSRIGQALGVAALLIALTTAVLWFQAWAEIVRTS